VSHKETTVVFKFVDDIPQRLIQNKVYISMNHATAVHLCLCGCREQVVTPFSPNDWKIVFDGNTISFRPSIGNWSFACQSHYWITKNEVKWAGKFTKTEIASIRLIDKTERIGERGEMDSPTQVTAKPNIVGLIARLFKKLKGL
jgi:hypothetical protein